MTLQERMHAKSLGAYLSCASALARDPLALSLPATVSPSKATGGTGRAGRRIARIGEEDASRKIKHDREAISFSSRNMQTPEGEPMPRLTPRW